VYRCATDGFDAFKEAGDCFDADVAQRVRQYVYSAGNSRDPAETYRLFRGRCVETLRVSCCSQFS
jgi:Zn-dependent oligopeptidase